MVACPIETLKISFSLYRIESKKRIIMTYEGRYIYYHIRTNQLSTSTKDSKPIILKTYSLYYSKSKRRGIHNPLIQLNISVWVFLRTYIPLFNQNYPARTTGVCVGQQHRLSHRALLVTSTFMCSMKCSKSPITIFYVSGSTS